MKGRESGRERFLVYLALSVFGLTMILPFLWSLSTALKAESQVHEYPFRWIPSREIHEVVDEHGGMLKVRVLRRMGDRVRVKVAEGPRKRELMDLPAAAVHSYRELDQRPGNFPASWRAYPFVSFGRAYLNSLCVALAVTLGQVITSSLAAYAFARLRFAGRDILFFGYLATMMVPGAVTMIPVFILLRNLGWVDTYKALIIPGIFTAYGTFMLRQFFLTLPKELEDAAKIDGCNYFLIFWKIILPLSKPALATLTTFTFMGAWMNFMWPLIVINTEDKFTLPVGLAYFQSLHHTDWTLLMAASVMMILPILIVFIFNQRFFVEGIKLTGIKG